ncbi:YqzK family protein [Brevibacillus humidisoli]|uniref:DUF4227 family protein n=1 Tax=Brevibacillus humidisoli TaxID=2895522 RepID=UPI001E568B3A|nr:DUF4227 family protein [Brevibacillus humidisoli]UFJ42872.1 YqzK family protein [Brevibacillus humidisoli]
MGGRFRRIMDVVRFFLVFVTCSLLGYGIVTFLSENFLPANPYREPQGNAVKVVRLLQENSSTDLDWYLERLQLFYLVGE